MSVIVATGPNRSSPYSDVNIDGSYSEKTWPWTRSVTMMPCLLQNWFSIRILSSLSCILEPGSILSSVQYVR